MRVCVCAAFQGSGEPADGEHGGWRRLWAQPGQQLQRRWTSPAAQQQRIREVKHTWLVYRCHLLLLLLLPPTLFTATCSFIARVVVLSSSAVRAGQRLPGGRTQGSDPDGRPATVRWTREHRPLPWHVSTRQQDIRGDWLWKDSFCFFCMLKLPIKPHAPVSFPSKVSCPWVCETPDSAAHNWQVHREAPENCTGREKTCG